MCGRGETDVVLCSCPQWEGGRPEGQEGLRRGRIRRDGTLAHRPHRQAEFNLEVGLYILGHT